MARILVYHRFPDLREVRASLASQCGRLRRYWQPVSLDELIRKWRSGDPLVSRSVVVTVDDGYRDFLTVAHPVFAAHNIPITAFLPTDFLDGRCWIWVDQVRHLFRLTPLAGVQFELRPGEFRFFPLRSVEERNAAAQIVKETAKEMRDLRRRELLGELPSILKVSLPAQPYPEDRPLTWDEVRKLAQEGVRFGAHSRSHPILSRLDDERSLADEIRGSKDRIESELDCGVEHFCYPNGQWTDIGPAAVAVVKRSGFRSAVTLMTGSNSPGDDPFLLKRMAVEPARQK